MLKNKAWSVHQCPLCGWWWWKSLWWKDKEKRASLVEYVLHPISLQNGDGDWLEWRWPPPPIGHVVAPHGHINHGSNILWNSDFGPAAAAVRWVYVSFVLITFTHTSPLVYMHNSHRVLEKLSAPNSFLPFWFVRKWRKCLFLIGLICFRQPT